MTKATGMEIVTSPPEIALAQPAAIGLETDPFDMWILAALVP